MLQLPSLLGAPASHGTAQIPLLMYHIRQWAKHWGLTQGDPGEFLAPGFTLVGLCLCCEFGE